MLFHGCLQDRSKTPNLPWKLQWKQERISLEDVTVMAPQNNWGWLLKSIRPATNLSRSEVVHIFLEMSPWIWTTKLTQKPFKIPTANPSDRVGMFIWCYSLGQLCHRRSRGAAMAGGWCRFPCTELLQSAVVLGVGLRISLNSIISIVTWHNYGNSPFLIGKSTISMAIFHSYVKLPEGISRLVTWDKHATLKKLLLLRTEDIVIYTLYIPYITLQLFLTKCGWNDRSKRSTCWSAGAEHSWTIFQPRTPSTEVSPRGWRWGVGKPRFSKKLKAARPSWRMLKHSEAESRKKKT